MGKDYKYKVLCKVIRAGVHCGAIVSENNQYVTYLNTEQIRILSDKGLINANAVRRGAMVLIKYADVPEIDYNKITIQLEALTGILSKRNGNAERAKKYISKCKLIGLDIKIDVISDTDITLVSVPDGTGTFEIPDFITRYALKVSNSGNANTVISPFTGTHYNKVVINCRLHTLEELFSGIESDRLEVVINNNATIFNMDACFNNALFLKEIHFIGINTSKVTSMAHTFSGCKSLQNINLEVFDTRRVEDTTMMFCNCDSLKYLDISTFNLSNNIKAPYMFGGCKSLERLNVGDKFLCSRLEDASSMFRGCISLSDIDLSNQKMKNIVYTCGMFDGCSLLESVDLSSSKFNDLEDAHCMFMNCIHLKDVDFGDNSFESLKEAYDMFKNCHELSRLNISSIESPDLEDASGMFFRCKSLRNVDMSKMRDCSLLQSDEMFYDCSLLDCVNLGKLDIGEDCDTDSMFYNTTIITLIASDRVANIYRNG